MKNCIIAKSYDYSLEKLLTEDKKLVTKVHSVFNHAICVKTENMERLIFAVQYNPEVDMNQPGGVVAQAPDLIGGSLEKEIELDFSNAILWSEKYPLEAPWNSASFFNLSKQILNFLNFNELKFLPLITELATANKFDKIIGLGDGLTPAGDDFLVGMLNCIYYFNYYSIENSLQCSDDRYNNLIDIIKKNKHKTTDISRTFIEYALEGRISQRVIDLLGTPDIKHIQYGHNSGYYHLAGILFALEKKIFLNTLQLISIQKQFQEKFL